MSEPALPSVAPFACTFTPEVPDLLAGLRCSLALTTYQADKVLLLSASGEGLTQLGRSFDTPMGLAVTGSGPGLRLAVATKAEVVVLANAPTMAPSYPNKPGEYDSLFLPRATYYTGPLDLHDLAWGTDADGRRALWAVNTRFSCLCRITERVSFEPEWAPPFVTALEPTDRCHLNGLALDGGRPRYVTALGATDAPRGWSEGRLSGGVLLDVASSATVLAGLPMPHSPRVFDGVLWAVLSATGELVRVNPAAGTYDVVNRVGGFARGLARRGDYLFVGVSKLRKRNLFGDLPIAAQPIRAGVVVVHEPSGRIAGRVDFLASVEEIYDVQVLPEVGRPGIVGPAQEAARRAVAVPDGGYWVLEAPPAGAEAGGGAR